jgi:hypothetical protein
MLAQRSELKELSRDETYLVVSGIEGVVCIDGSRRITLSASPADDVALHNGRLYHTAPGEKGAYGLYDTLRGDLINSRTVQACAEAPGRGIISYNGDLVDFYHDATGSWIGNAIKLIDIIRYLPGVVVSQMTVHDGQMIHAEFSFHGGDSFIHQTNNDVVLAGRFFPVQGLVSHQGRLYDTGDGLKETLAIPDLGDWDSGSSSLIVSLASHLGKLVGILDKIRNYDTQRIYDLLDPRVNEELVVPTDLFTNRFRQLLTDGISAQPRPMFQVDDISYLAEFKAPIYSVVSIPGSSLIND